MAARRMLVHTTFLLLLPIIVAIYGLSVWSAIGLVLLMLLWRWLITLSGFVLPEKMPALVLDTISASHFVEKVRWNLDLTGIDYVEKAAGGTLGAYFLGRTVPRLRLRTGAVQSEIGNSPEILRYLYGAYANVPDVDVSHLEPTPERRELEKQIDRYGVNMQVWAYSLLLDDRDATLKFWGIHNPKVPYWQRQLLKILFPLLGVLIRRSFRITPERALQAGEHIEDLLARFDATLTDGRASILGDKTPNYTDFAFAGMTGLWAHPEKFAGSQASVVQIRTSDFPDAMQAQVNAWSENYPTVVAWVRELYEERR